MFATARIGKRCCRLSLDAHRYIEVVEAQGDGQRRMLSFGRGSTRSCVDHNISDWVCTSTTSQSMENEKATYQMLKIFRRIPTRLMNRKLAAPYVSIPLF